MKNTSIIHRFSDVAGELCTMLTPIQGFSNQPLVSLEAAVEPLVSIMPDVKTRVSIAKEAAQDPPDGLSLDQSASIALYTIESEPYTSSFYYILNSTLRNEDRGELKPWFLYLKLILTALSRLSPIRLTIYRSLKLDTQIEHERYQEGKDVIWWGFSSCTTNKKISQKEHFLTSSGTRTLFIIECFNGKDIGPHAYNKNDQEVLLLPATRFQVVRCDRERSDIHKIYMKEVEPQSILLEPLFSPSLKETSPKSTTPGSIKQLCQQSFDQMFKH